MKVSPTARWVLYRKLENLEAVVRRVYTLRPAIAHWALLCKALRSPHIRRLRRDFMSRWLLHSHLARTGTARKRAALAELKAVRLCGARVRGVARMAVRAWRLEAKADRLERARLQRR